MMPMSRADKYVSDYCGGGYTDRWQPDDWPGNEGANPMPTHAQRVAEIEEQFEIAAEQSVSDSVRNARIVGLEARIATLERQVARLLEAVPRAGPAGERAFYVDGGGPGPRK